ncbi:MAG: acyl-CoA thioesterase [Flavobacteriaceae bacterium]|nr:acyl-CoA thioesterase [Flavobacteriaceae bacterium]
MRNNQLKIRVRYSETDQMGYVYYGNYASYFEIARTEWLRKLEISYKEMEQNGVMLPVHSMNIKYIRPAKYDDKLLVTVKIKSRPTSKIEFEYTVHNQNDELLTIGETILVFVDMNKKRPIRIPENILSKIEDIFEDENYSSIYSK